MKTFSLSSLVAAAVLGLGSITVSQAQEPVSTGTIQGLVPRAGTLTLRSDQTSRPITFYGIDRATIFTEDGQPALIGDLEAGMKATIQYAVRGNRWYISKIILPGARAPISQADAAVAGAPINLDPALRTPAALDDDRTTQPGSKAAIDGDRTT
ncbi:MAG: hypothetical protein EOP84_19600, partial [Verrucomicrobiaceae bacterium]